MKAYHLTKPSLVDSIVEEGYVLPNSTRSALGSIPIVKYFLSREHRERGTFCVYEKHYSDFISDTILRERFRTLRSENGKLAKLPVTIPNNCDVLDEAIMIYEVHQLAVRRGLENATQSQILMKLPFLIAESIPLYNKFVDTRVPFRDYKGEFRLPVLFVREPIRLENKDFEIINI